MCSCWGYKQHPAQYSERSCRPQPSGSGREAARKDTRQDRRLKVLSWEFHTCTGCVHGHFQALGAGTPRRSTNPNTGGRPAQRLADTIPRTGRPPVHVLTLAVTRRSSWLVRRWLTGSIVWVAGTPFHRRATRFFLSRVFAASLAS